MTVRQRIALSVIASLAVVYGPLMAWVRLGVNGGFLFFAPDAFYYLQVADQYSRTGIYTFDGVRATTGFHPLWQFFLGAAFTLAPSLHAKEHQIAFLFFASAVLTAVGAGLLTYGFSRFVRRPALALLVVVPGLLFLGSGGLTGGIWSFADGLESPLSLAIFGGFFLLLPSHENDASPSLGVLVLWSTVLALVVLARLDDAFLVVALAIAVARRESTWIRRAFATAACGLFPGVVTVAYLAWNWHVSGRFMPSSAAIKDGWALVLNLSLIGRALAPMGLWLSGDVGTWRPLASKSLLLIVPIVAGLLSLCIRRDRAGVAAPQSGGRRLTLEILALYVVIKGLYNLVFVWLWHQGYWYFVLSAPIAGLLLVDVWRRYQGMSPDGQVMYGAERTTSLRLLLGALAIAIAVVSVSTQGGAVGHALVAVGIILFAVLVVWGPHQWPVAATLLVLSLLLADVDVADRISGRSGDYYTRMWAARDRVRAALLATEATPAILELDDGVMSYALSIPGMSGFGLTGDTELVDAKRRNALLDLAYQRGFRTIASLDYLPPPDSPLYATQSMARLVSEIPTMEGEDVGKWRFTLVMHDAETGAVFISFAPR